MTLRQTARGLDALHPADLQSREEMLARRTGFRKDNELYFYLDEIGAESERLMREAMKPKPVQGQTRQSAPLEELGALKEQMGQLAETVGLLASIVRGLKPEVTVNVNPQLKIPPTVEKTRILRDTQNPNRIVGSVKETEEKQ